MVKQDLRERIWDRMEAEGIARFPFPPHDRVPNFVGAEDAAERLAETDAYTEASVLKCNPDSPQLPLRRRALHDGKTVYLAAPRLRDKKPFLALDPAEIPPEEYDRAPTVSHAAEYARPVGPKDVPHVDLVVSGSVAVTETGTRVGKGEGYSDLEFAVLSELEAVDSETTVATTVHEVQVVGDDAVTPADHDVPMDIVCTPERTIRTETDQSRPDGVNWSALSAARIEEIPVLDRLRE
ncbi:5-formyltetrahydrofolate cyclo-ligase [Halogeometricum borinquense DSM 11551]|uniref:5-formyltetrahydrofolate cyclo-ligase n=1 Tax=Halogeometricum borinquense (strain ATCC 700274 / DSM 11551 / JCM 10706 / KCTC 4070 / PR3) TaxID=469382 RepID=E4NM29_HALBP|nr:5-formyltetrahydrofolate cyclo-ligase [Halogeometricum borinquense]ADQ66128.1 5-formyltetrahydrofolate cyclo-ligase [Halogeometricum borinquense DSM 11551]ELY27377.1 5-formyltetrahydrofolate cyclo-ligase [Halogeometricum borinquense DSM 11551]